MKRVLFCGLFLALLALPVVASAEDVYVHGYTRRDGTHVNPYHRTAPDSNPYNNYGTRGNLNPYTGQKGTVDPNPTNPWQSQPSPWQTQTDPWQRR